MRCDPGEIRLLPLEAHRLLSDVPLSDVTAIDLPGGGPARTLADVRALVPGGLAGAGGAVTRLLFAVRSGLGKLLRWDRPLSPEEEVRHSYRQRLSADLVRRSRREPGSSEGPFRVLYELPDEMLVEVRNATVHAFLSSALVPRPGGYRLYWAVYVKPVSRLTPLYMAIIEPFRRFVVYPSLARAVRRSWRARYG